MPAKFLFIGLILCTPICNSASPIPSDGRIIFKVGNVEVTQYEYDKQLAASLSQTKDAHNSWDKDSWEVTYKNQLLLLAEAHDLGFHQSEEVLAKLDNMERHMLSSLNSPLIQSQLPQSIAAGYSNQEDAAHLFPSPSQILEAAKKRISDETLHNAFSHISQIPVEERRTINPTIFGKLKKNTLFTYQKDQVERSVSIEDYFIYYNNLVLSPVLKSVEIFASSIDGYILGEYYYNAATKLGLQNDPRFSLDREFYRKQCILLAYEKEFLSPRIEIQESDIVSKFDQSRKQFRRPFRIASNLYYYNAPQAAERAFSKAIRATYTEQGPILDKADELVRKETDVALTLNDVDKLPEENLKRLFMSGKPGNLVMAKTGEEFVIAQISHVLEFEYATLDDVRNMISESLHQERLAELKAERAASLRNRYAITSLIDN